MLWPGSEKILQSPKSFQQKEHFLMITTYWKEQKRINLMCLLKYKEELDQVFQIHGNLAFHLGARSLYLTVFHTIHLLTFFIDGPWPHGSYICNFELHCNILTPFQGIQLKAMISQIALHDKVSYYNQEQMINLEFSQLAEKPYYYIIFNFVLHYLREDLDTTCDNTEQSNDIEGI